MAHVSRVSPKHSEGRSPGSRRSVFWELTGNRESPPQPRPAWSECAFTTFLRRFLCILKFRSTVIYSRCSVGIFEIITQVLHKYLPHTHPVTGTAEELSNPILRWKEAPMRSAASNVLVHHETLTDCLATTCQALCTFHKNIYLSTHWTGFAGWEFKHKGESMWLCGLSASQGACPLHRPLVDQEGQSLCPAPCPPTPRTQLAGSSMEWNPAPVFSHTPARLSTPGRLENTLQGLPPRFSFRRHSHAWHRNKKEKFTQKH